MEKIILHILLSGSFYFLSFNLWHDGVITSPNKKLLIVVIWVWLTLYYVWQFLKILPWKKIFWLWILFLLCYIIGMIFLPEETKQKIPEWMHTVARRSFIFLFFAFWFIAALISDVIQYVFSFIEEMSDRLERRFDPYQTESYTNYQNKQNKSERNQNEG